MPLSRCLRARAPRLSDGDFNADATARLNRMPAAARIIEADAGAFIIERMPGLPMSAAHAARIAYICYALYLSHRMHACGITRRTALLFPRRHAQAVAAAATVKGGHTSPPFLIGAALWTVLGARAGRSH